MELLTSVKSCVTPLVLKSINPLPRPLIVNGAVQPVTSRNRTQYATPRSIRVRAGAVNGRPVLPVLTEKSAGSYVVETSMWGSPRT